MQSPINEIDFKRFIKLAELIKNNSTEDDNMKIYISGEFVSIEMSGHHIPKDKIREIISIPVEKLFL